jgi:hypothetical protein
MAAPSQHQMRAACARAAAHVQRTHQGGDAVRVEMTVAPVPQLAPEIGNRSDWYKVGSLYLDPQDRLLHVYLDPNADAVKLEQDLIDIP